MSIQNDAGKLLVCLYEKYLKDVYFIGEVNKISKELEWDDDKTLRASRYLSDSGITETDETGNIIMKILPKGIDIAENKTKFKTTFGINLGIFNVSWSN